MSEDKPVEKKKPAGDFLRLEMWRDEGKSQYNLKINHLKRTEDQKESTNSSEHIVASKAELDKKLADYCLTFKIFQDKPEVQADPPVADAPAAEAPTQ